MTDCHLIVYLDNENLGIDTQIGFLSGMVPKLNYCIFDISAIMLIYANYVNYEKCSIVIIRHSAVSNNWGFIQLIYVIKAQYTYHFQINWVLYQLENSKLWRELAAILDLC